MTIEVRQMLVKSTVLQKQEAETEGRDLDACQDVEEMKEDILAECRRLIIEMLRNGQER